MKRLLAHALCLALLASAPMPAPARQSEVVAEARGAVADLEAATRALTKATGPRARVSALTQAIAAHEAGLAALRDALRRATLREKRIRARFEAKRDSLAQLLGVMTAMERSAGPLLLLHPSGALGTARSGMMLADVAPALRSEVETVRADLTELSALRATQTSAAKTLADGLRALQSARTQLSQAAADRRDLPQRFADDPEALRDLVESADTLSAFAEGLLDMPERSAGEPPIPDFREARGELSLPVRGTVLRRPGEADPAGVRRPGLTLATTPRALVTTPWSATIRYVGPLLDYANVMVLDPGNDYLMVIAGLDIVYGQLGEVLSRGDAIGLMGGENVETGEFLSSARQTGEARRTETLYVELREGTEAVDPTAWFTQTRE